MCWLGNNLERDKRQILNNAHKLLIEVFIDRAIKSIRIIEMDPSDAFALQKVAELHSRMVPMLQLSAFTRTPAVLKSKGS